MQMCNEHLSKIFFKSLIQEGAMSRCNQFNGEFEVPWSTVNAKMNLQRDAKLASFLRRQKINYPYRRQNLHIYGK